MADLVTVLDDRPELGGLRDEGVAEETLARVRVPIGLDLGARSAPEIALAILAEIQAARAGGSGQPLSARRRAPTTS